MCCGDQNHNHDALYLAKNALNGHYTKTEIDALIADYYTKSQIDALIAGYYTKSQIDALIADYYTKTQIDALHDIPAFAAYLSVTATNATGDGSAYQIACNTEIYDALGNFGGLGKIFTAPEDGLYGFVMGAYIYPLTSNHTYAYDALVTSNRTYFLNERNPYAVAYQNTYNSTGFNILAQMDAGDTAWPEIVVSGGSKTVNVYGSNTYTFFSGHLVRRI